MNNPDTGCPELDSQGLRVRRLEEMAVQNFNTITDTIRRLDRVIEQVKQLQEGKRELQKQIDRLYRVGLESDSKHAWLPQTGGEGFERNREMEKENDALSERILHIEQFIVGFTEKIGSPDLAAMAKAMFDNEMEPEGVLDTNRGFVKAAAPLQKWIDEGCPKPDLPTNDT